jgi:hypothetical protein
MRKTGSTIRKLLQLCTKPLVSNLKLTVRIMCETITTIWTLPEAKVKIALPSAKKRAGANETARAKYDNCQYSLKTARTQLNRQY